MFLRLLQALTDKIEIALRRLDAAFRFLLEDVQHIDDVAELYRVGSTKRAVTALILGSYLDYVA